MTTSASYKSRAELALQAARREARDTAPAYDQLLIEHIISIDLSSTKGVTAIGSLAGMCELWPTLDSVVAMFECHCSGRDMDRPRLIRSLRSQDLSWGEIAAGALAIQKCVENLEETESPYVLLAHVQGMARPVLHFRDRDRDSALHELATEICHYVMSYARVPS